MLDLQSGVVGQARIELQPTGRRFCPASQCSRRYFRPRHDDVLVPGGTFLMGDAFTEGYPSDGELPVHEVWLSPFRIDTAAVTNVMFSKFVEDTGYRTDAEEHGSSVVFQGLSTETQIQVRGPVAGAPACSMVQGADWAHPTGGDTDWKSTPDHPVVHVSHNDALAYCAWAGRRLPTEAEWEYAARGGLQGKRYPWGDDLLAAHEEHANTWQAVFVRADTMADGFSDTVPVQSFAPNDFGLYEVTGNVGEWCADWFLNTYDQNSPSTDPQGPPAGDRRVIRGGSVLCHDSWLNRYRVAVRSSSTAETSSSKIGFRTVED